MESDDVVLARLASGGSMEYSTWPILLSTIVSRIETIAITEFPTPILPSPLPPKPRTPIAEPTLLAPLPSSDPIEPPSERTAVEDDSSSQETNKENTNPAPPPPRLPTPPTQPTTEPGTLPPQVVWLMNDITTTLTVSFPKYPPHTIQRLAELVVNPTQHYRSLPAYLHALDRVVHVTSGNNIYPLPPAVADMSSMGPHTRLTNGAPDSPTANAQPNGAASASAALNVGSDEALGGALLTPIPWLQRSRIDSSSRDSESSEDITSQLEAESLAAESSSLSAQPIHTPTSDATTSGPSAEQQGSTSPTDAASAQQLRHQRRMEGQVRTESTETIEGPNGMGHIETVSVSVNGIPSHGAATTAAAAAALAASLSRGVTQGELLRQEQRAGVVPLSQLSRQPVQASSAQAQQSTEAAAEEAPAPEPAAETQPKTPPPVTDADGDAAMGSDAGEPDEEALSSPHARGPEEIGPEDTGPQTAAGSAAMRSGGVDVRIDIEAAVGRKADPVEGEDAEKAAEVKVDDGKGKEKADDPEKTEEKAGDAMDVEKREATPKRELPEGEKSAVPTKKLKGEEDEADGGPLAGAET